jgi:hypothetical protein
MLLGTAKVGVIVGVWVAVPVDGGVGEKTAVAVKVLHPTSSMQAAYGTGVRNNIPEQRGVLSKNCPTVFEQLSPCSQQTAGVGVFGGVSVAAGIGVMVAELVAVTLCVTVGVEVLPGVLVGVIVFVSVTVRVDSGVTVGMPQFDGAAPTPATHTKPASGVPCPAGQTPGVVGAEHMRTP